MKVIHNARDLSAAPRKVCVAIGMFDGVHLGHQQVIRQTLADARQHNSVAVTVTFDQHPNAIVAPERTPPLIYSLAQKLRVISSLGVEAVLLIHFDLEFSQQSGELFIRSLVRDFGRLDSIAVGANFSFGRGRSGNVGLLADLGQELGFSVHALPAVSFEQIPISSTRIRESIRQGQLDLARQLLGRPYSVSGRVLEGDRLGHKIGFPTANLDVSGLVLPPDGVYAGYAHENGQTHRAVANLGRRPTLSHPEPAFRFEVHLLDYSADLYGQELEFTFAEPLRKEQKFASLDALQKQIASDVRAARKSLR
jgi:riboflavin kinase / FMN adenylyltransferase